MAVASTRCLLGTLQRTYATTQHYIPLSVKSVEKSRPIETLLDDYKKVHFDDTITADDQAVQHLKQELFRGSRSALASAITLVESRNPQKRARGNVLLQELLAAERKKHAEKGQDAMIYRIAISGSPGVGKSSFIETLGTELIEKRNKKVAILTVDPTSASTGGSLLGDLTRMQELSKNPRAFIRQSPTSGSLGGVTRGTHEAIILCEGAGYDVVIIETVGVGQSEYAVAEMCDLFCLLLSPAHGDELQGVKRGIMELADLLVVTKDDGDLETKAKITQAEYISALKFMRPRIRNWKPRVLRSSIMKPESVSKVCDEMYDFWEHISSNGTLMEKRKSQLTKWMWSHVRDEIMNVFSKHPRIASLTATLEQEVQSGKITPGLAAEKLIRVFFGI
ncbi:unnamed protein product, partial [Mesorhabditis belari]|uniref:Uncharacterized protein n=1 Tax=Mesorhabditis belari TaxID=2138241 RepID=A0AAF3J7Y2_9BILA